MAAHAAGPVAAVIAHLVRRHHISHDVALDMLDRAARRKGVSLHHLATTVVGDDDRRPVEAA